MNIRKRFKLPGLKNIKQAWNNRSGSEALEMVYSTATLCILILSTLLILGYALQVNAVSYAGKRIARSIEVSGVANPAELDELLGELLSNSEEIGAAVTVHATDGWLDAMDYKIQLRDKFTVILTATYKVTLLNPGGWEPLDFELPITVKVNGQSEIYWKT